MDLHQFLNSKFMITINKFRVNSLIPKAVEIIKLHEFKKKDSTLYPDTEKPKTYNGYISSFNANCIIMTPLSTSIMYNSSKGSSEDKSIVTLWILNLLLKENSSLTTKENLSDYIEENTSNGMLNTRALINLLTAGNALKLAIRKFKLV